MTVTGQRPRVGVGMPVYNGERFIEQAIDSLLAQTFSDFELIISDNGSTDRTEAICRAYAARDGRVRYERQPVNLGATRNYNLTFERARGDYFIWVAHDDAHEPGSLAACVEALDRDPEVVLAVPRVHDVDEAGRTVRKKSHGLGADAPRPSDRFRGLIRNDHTCEAVFGLIRRKVLARTPLIGNYVDSDRVLLAELGLYGRFCEIEHDWFVHRVHAEASTDVYDSRQTRAAWFDPSKAGKPTFPWWRELGEYVAAIRRTPISAADAVRCHAHLVWWLGHSRAGLQEDFVYAARCWLGPVKRRLLGRTG